jgi:WD40 repeat protein
MRDSTLAQLEGRGALINEATAELLSQLGVMLTETGLKTLLAGNTSTVLAEAGLARGIAAQAGGAEVEALFNFTQAITFDPSQLEALSRLNILSSTISGGTISQRIVNDIQARDRWLEVFKETARFYNDHPPFEIIFDPNLIQIGETDYTKRTANIGMRIALDSSKAGFDALNALLEGLEKTGRRSEWGFLGWPLMDITPRTTGTVLFGGKRSLSYKVDVSLINENNKTIGNNSVTLTANTIGLGFQPGGKGIWTPSSVEDVVIFQNIRIEDLTPTLTIVIVAVNGIPSRNINASGYMKIETGDLERGHTEFVWSVAFSPDGRQIVSGSGDGTVKLWDTATGRNIRTFSHYFVLSVAFSPDGRQIVSGSADNTVKLWDTATGRNIRTFSGHTEVVWSVAFSPDGRQIISGSEDNTVKLWDAVTGRNIRTFSGHTETVSSVAFSPDGRQIISGSDDDVKLWDVATGRLIRTFSDKGSALSVAFSPDGRQIVSGSLLDDTVKLWDVDTGRNIRTFSDLEAVMCLAFSPDGRQIVSGSGDTTIKLWDVNTGQLIRTMGTERRGWWSHWE